MLNFRLRQGSILSLKPTPARVQAYYIFPFPAFHSQGLNMSRPSQHALHYDHSAHSPSVTSNSTSPLDLSTHNDPHEIVHPSNHNCTSHPISTLVVSFNAPRAIAEPINFWCVVRTVTLRFEKDRGSGGQLGAYSASSCRNRTTSRLKKSRCLLQPWLLPPDHLWGFRVKTNRGLCDVRVYL